MEENATLSLRGIDFSFGRTQVISGLSLDVPAGSFTTLLGESGCGKTTLLRLIAGFYEPGAGDILIDGKSQRGIPPNKRAVGMVFQDYALFPHLTVRQNLLYGPRIRRDAAPPLDETAGFLGIGGLLGRYPHELSGGQQQRVALGRALMLRPRILLMDEPLSSLDAKLRAKVRDELREIQARLGITTVYVTHDQDEALSLSDAIAVIDGGRLRQHGTPREIYFEPRDTFTADFVGRANFLQENGKTVLVRPEWLARAAGGCADITGTVESAAFLGERTRFTVRTGAGDCVTADIPTLSAAGIARGQELRLRIVRRWVLPG